MPFEKAEESLRAAKCCFSQKLYNSATSRAYYAIYQAAQVALQKAGFSREAWSHAGLHATFTNELIHRRKLYPPVFARYLNRVMELRIIADYRGISISRKQGEQATRWAEEIFNNVRER